VNHLHHTRRASGAPGWDQPPSWGQPPAWGLPVADQPLPLRAAGQLGRWLWPTTAVGSFLVLVGYVLAHDPPPHPGLSERGLLTVTLAAVVVLLLTIRHAAGPGPLARTMAEYAVVALLAVLLASAGGPQQPTDQPSRDTNAAITTEDRPALIRAPLAVWDWLAQLWRRAAQHADRHGQPSPTTTPTEGQAMAPFPPASSTSTRRPT
jgi:hypothetical protein